MTTPTAITTVRPSPRDILFPPETNTSVAAISGSYCDFSIIDELHMKIKKADHGLPFDPFFMKQLLLLHGWVDAYLQPGLVFSLKRDNTINKREQGVIRSFLHIRAGMKLRASLPYQNIPSLNKLPSKPLYSESL
jgi:hypothetical protein